MISPAVKRGGVVIAALAALSLGCASYRGTGKDVQPSALAAQGDWVIVSSFPLVLQRGTKDCGAAALAAVLNFWGRDETPRSVADATGRTGERLRAGDIERHARDSGLAAYAFFGTMGDVIHEIDRGRPVIVGVAKPYSGNKGVSHYEVVVGYEPQKRQVLLLDPGKGWQSNSYEGFAEEWAATKAVTVVAFPRGEAASTVDEPSG